MKPITSKQARTLSEMLAFAMDSDFDGEMHDGDRRFKVLSRMTRQGRRRMFAVVVGYGGVDNTTTVNGYSDFVYDEMRGVLRVTSDALDVTLRVRDGPSCKDKGAHCRGCGCGCETPRGSLRDEVRMAVEDVMEEMNRPVPHVEYEPVDRMPEWREPPKRFPSPRFGGERRQNGRIRALSPLF